MTLWIRSTLFSPTRQNFNDNHNHLQPLKIPKTIFIELLKSCTMKSPFSSLDGKLFLQKDGIAMGSPLRPTFAGFYMGHIEKNLLNNKPDLKPAIYCRYADDIFVVTTIFLLLENSSVLKFTSEISVINKIPFLDVDIDGSSGNFTTKIYRKPTDKGKCLNALSECPNKYKSSVVKGMI